MSWQYCILAFGKNKFQHKNFCRFKNQEPTKKLK